MDISYSKVNAESRISKKDLQFYIADILLLVPVQKTSVYIAWSRELCSIVMFASLKSQQQGRSNGENKASCCMLLK